MDLMRTAALDALERLHGVSWQRDIESFYGSLGEVLTWRSALAEAMGKKEEPLYSGLAFARNALLHRVVIVAAVHVQPSGKASPLLGDAARYVWQDVKLWGFLENPHPEANTPKRRADYDREVARHAVFPMVDAALLDLGVNLWLVHDDNFELTPRRQKRQASVPPSHVPGG